MTHKAEITSPKNFRNSQSFFRISKMEQAQKIAWFIQNYGYAIFEGFWTLTFFGKLHRLTTLPHLRWGRGAGDLLKYLMFRIWKSSEFTLSAFSFYSFSSLLRVCVDLYGPCSSKKMSTKCCMTHNVSS